MNKLMLTGLLFLMACSTADESKTSTDGDDSIRTEEVEYSAGGVSLKGYLAFDENVDGQRPGVLVVHEWWGHNDYARKRARMLAELGYTALAIDMYGDGKQANHPEDAAKFMNAVLENIESGESRFRAALELLKNHSTTDTTKMAAIGYCFGGGVVLHMARIGTDLDAVVSFHGGLAAITPAVAGEVKARILVCHGADDPFEKPEQIEAFKEEMDDARVDYRFIAYEGAVHSFTNPAADSFGKKFNLPLAYNAEADQESWQEMKTLFAEVWQ